MGLGSVFIKSKYNNSEEQLIKISLNELHPYLHDVPNCPQLVDSIFLLPTSMKPYDPFKITCLQDLTNFKDLTLVKLMNKNGRVGVGCKFELFIQNFN